MEIASYDSGGKLTSIIRDGAELDITAGFRVFLDGDVVEDVQPHSQSSQIERDGYELAWMGTTEFRNHDKIAFTAKWEEKDDKLHFTGTVSHPDRWPLTLKSLEYVIDIDRSWFVGGSIQSDDIPLTPQKKTDATTLLERFTDHISLLDASGNWALTLKLPEPGNLVVEDVWEKSGRHYRIRIPLATGMIGKEDEIHFDCELKLSGKANPIQAELNVDFDEKIYPFDGYGANLCWGNDGPVTRFITSELDMTWTRHEMKLSLWDVDRSGKNPMLREDFERIQEIDKAGIPWIISAWRIPERLYENANQENMRTHGRRLAGDKWPELLELIGSYLMHLKNEYGIEPALFSFNEPDLGVSVGFSDTGHRDAIKRIGAHLAGLGLKTQMLLGDCANPHDSHEYVMPTAADPEAMRYVGALSFHSWWGATPEQYKAWSDMAHWLNLPLFIGEAGFDPGTYRNRSYDSYDYGLEEAQLNLEILRYAQPQASLYWQYTSDYALCREINGQAIPTGRFWLMKHWSNLTPKKGHVVASSSNLDQVLIAAFTNEKEAAIHILNHGPAGTATLHGLGKFSWTPILTTDETDFEPLDYIRNESGTTTLQLPARSLITLVREDWFDPGAPTEESTD